MPICVLFGGKKMTIKEIEEVVHNVRQICLDLKASHPVKLAEIATIISSLIDAQSRDKQTKELHQIVERIRLFGFK